MKIQIDTANIDWPLLDKQRRELEKFPQFAGVVNLIDNIRKICIDTYFDELAAFAEKCPDNTLIKIN